MGTLPPIKSTILPALHNNLVPVEILVLISLLDSAELWPLPTAFSKTRSDYRISNDIISINAI